MKFIVKALVLMLCASLMLSVGVPFIEKTGALLTASFTSATMQAFDDISEGGDTDITVEKLSSDFSDMTLSELIETIKMLASDITAEEVYDLYSYKG